MGDVKAGDFGGDKSPRQVLLDALDECENYEDLVVVAIDKEGFVRTGWASGFTTTHVGMLAFASQRLIDLARDDDG